MSDGSCHSNDYQIIMYNFQQMPVGNSSQLYSIVLFLEATKIKHLTDEVKKSSHVSKPINY